MIRLIGSYHTEGGRSLVGDFQREVAPTSDYSSNFML